MKFIIFSVMDMWIEIKMFLISCGNEMDKVSNFLNQQVVIFAVFGIFPLFF